MTEKPAKLEFYIVFFIMVFFLRKLAVGLLVSSFFILMQAQAGIVELVNKQFKDLSIKLSATF